jgi:hypothetical protein
MHSRSGVLPDAQTSYLVFNIMTKFLTSAFFIFAFTTIVSAQAWSWVSPSSSASFARIDGVAVDTAGNSFVTGAFMDLTAFGSDTLNTTTPFVAYGFIAKYDINGACVWAQSDPSISDGTHIGVDANANCYVLGYITGQYSLTRWDSSGALLGTTLFPVSVTMRDLFVYPNGNCLVTGSLINGQAVFGTDTFNGSKAIVALYDAAGNVLDAFSFGRAGKIHPDLIETDANGDYIIATTLLGTDTIGAQSFTCVGSTVLLVKFDAAGTLLWSQLADAPAPGTAGAYPTGMCIDLQGNTYLTSRWTTQDFMFGSDTIFMNPSGATASIIRFSPTGNVDWIVQPTFTGSGSVYFLDAVCDANSVYFTGYTEESFTAGTVSVNNTTTAYQMTYVIGIDFNGNTFFADHTSGLNSKAIPRSIAIDTAMGSLWIGGLERNTPTFGPYLLPPCASGADNSFLGRLQVTPLGVRDTQEQNTISILPGTDPHTFVLTVDGVQKENLWVTMYDMTGREVQSVQVQGSTTNINCSSFAGGIYTWTVTDGEQRLASGKLVN